MPHNVKSNQHTFMNLNLTLFLVFDGYIRQLSLLNDAKQLLAFACKNAKETILTEGSSVIEYVKKNTFHFRLTQTNRNALKHFLSRELSFNPLQPTFITVDL